MKVKAIQFVPLGRRAKSGDWAMCQSGSVTRADGSSIDNPYFQAVERREVEIDVPDPVPEWVFDAVHSIAQHTDGQRHDLSKKQRDCHVCIENAGVLFGHIRAHVEERAKAAAERLDDRMVGTMVPTERIIREEFLR